MWNGIRFKFPKISESLFLDSYILLYMHSKKNEFAFKKYSLITHPNKLRGTLRLSGFLVRNEISRIILLLRV